MFSKSIILNYIDDIRIKKSYKKLAMKYHPDKNKSQHASQLFIEVNEAYAYLSNETSTFQTKNIVKTPPRKRSKYSEDELKKRMEWARKYAQYKKVKEERVMELEYYKIHNSRRKKIINLINWIICKLVNFLYPNSCPLFTNSIPIDFLIILFKFYLRKN